MRLNPQLDFWNRRQLPAPVACGSKGRANCRDHAAPLASRPLNTITADEGAAMFPACRFAESAPCAGSVALPKSSETQAA